MGRWSGRDIEGGAGREREVEWKWSLKSRFKQATHLILEEITPLHSVFLFFCFFWGLWLPPPRVMFCPQAAGSSPPFLMCSSSLNLWVLHLFIITFFFSQKFSLFVWNIIPLFSIRTLLTQVCHGLRSYSFLFYLFPSCTFSSITSNSLGSASFRLRSCFLDFLSAPLVISPLREVFVPDRNLSCLVMLVSRHQVFDQWSQHRAQWNQPRRLELELISSAWSQKNTRIMSQWKLVNEEVRALPAKTLISTHLNNYCWH